MVAWKKPTAASSGRRHAQGLSGAWVLGSGLRLVGPNTTRYPRTHVSSFILIKPTCHGMSSV